MSRDKRAPQRHELRAVEALQLGVGELQRGERRRHVARKLQLLARDQQHLLDLGDRDFVARRREIAVERLQRRLLRLRFREPRLEQRDFRLGFAKLRRELRLRLRVGLRRRFDGGQALRHLDAQRLLRAPCRRARRQRRRRWPAPRRRSASPIETARLGTRGVGFRRDAFGFRSRRGSGNLGRVRLPAGWGQGTVDGIGHGRLGKMHVRF